MVSGFLLLDFVEGRHMLLVRINVYGGTEITASVS